MKKNQKKQLQYEFARKNIDRYLYLLRNNYYPNYNYYYVREVLRFVTGFNIRLKREEKLLFCKKCYESFYGSNKKIRLNSLTKTKDVICNNCGYIRRFPYK